MKLLITRFPGGGKDHPDGTDWLVRTVSEANVSIATRGSWHGITHVKGWKLSDTPITMSRNRAARYAIENGYNYLLMLDNDMVPDVDPSAPLFLPEALGFMAERREVEAEYVESFGDTAGEAEGFPMPATIAAPYCGPPPHESVYVFEWKTRESDTPEPNFTLEMIDRPSAAVRTGIQEVAALPTGLILYDVRVFRTLPPPWFCYEWTDAFQSEKASTEDVYQTRNASLLGMPQFVHWDCWAGHAKGKLVGRPTLITRDMVHDSLVQAVVRNRSSNERIAFVGDREVARSTFEGRTPAPSPSAIEAHRS